MHVVATAGHVDHGKSTLIRALTGMEPDRWAEERRRGMTIDLGYAWTTLPGGEQVAFVDVPGHHRFIGNMLAGVGPVPAVLLVVAADDGWGRQTAEHLAALRALDVRHGVLAVTRSDLGDAGLAIAEARSYLRGMPLEKVEAVAVSGATGSGLDDLRAALGRMVAGLPTPPSTATRLWVDRVFTMRGAGTVVTGTLATGRIAVGDRLVETGRGRTVQVRALQSLGVNVPSASAVSRVAVNLRDVKTDQIGRGAALVSAGRWALGTSIDVRLIGVAGRLPAEAILHIGSAAVLARLRPLGADTARLTLGAALPLHVGDRAILRDPGRQQVIGGALVLDIDPAGLTRRGSAARRARELADLDGRRDAVDEIRRLGAVRAGALIARGILDPAAGVPTGTLSIGTHLVSEDRWQHWQGELHEILNRRAAEHPMRPGLGRAELAQLLALPEAAVIDALVGRSDDLVADSGGVHRRSATATLPADAESALQGLCERLAERPFAAPERAELTSAGLTDAHLAIAVRTGLLLRIAPQVYLLPTAPGLAVQRLAGLPQPFTLSEARHLLGTTRRVAVPLLEMLDRRGATTRVDDQRRVLAG